MLQKKNWLLRGLLAAALAQLALGGAAKADEYDDLRAKWLARGGPVDMNDADVQVQVAASQAIAQNLWDTMHREDGRTLLWDNASNWAASATITTNFGRLNTLASAYVNGNDNLRGNPDVLAAILSATQWLVDNHYHVNMNYYDNWWDWQIGSPQAFNSMMVTLYANIPADQLASWLAIIDFYVPDPTNRANADGTPSTTTETGANLLDKAWVVVMRGLLGKDSAKMTAGRNAVSPALPYVTAGDGFYVDGSFIQHTHHPYIGGYGAVLLSDISRLYYLLNGSSWTISNDPNVNKPYDWVMQAFRPFIYDGAVMDSQRGRQLSRQFTTDHSAGRGIVATLVNLAGSLPADQANQVKSLIKGWMQRDDTFGPSYFAAVSGSSLSATDITQLKAVLNDPSIVEAAEPDQTHIFASVDRVVQRKPGYAFDLSLLSKRTGAFESGNGENLKGWWSGVGRTALHNADHSQYGRNYWATVDMTRLAGTTTDHTGSGTPVAWKFYANTKTGTGGAELLGQYAAVGMDYAMTNVTGSPLTGKKAWFYFGDKMVAVGAGIANTNGNDVETIVENRRLGDDGINTLTVAGTEKDAFMPWSETMPGVTWAHLAGNVPGSDIGYIFPDAPTVTGLRERRSGAWSDVYTLGDTTQVAENYLSLALDHGVNPAAAAYTYIVVPNKTAAETAAMAANTGITVLERSTSATAVKDTSQGVTGAVFWNDATKVLSAGGQPLITSDKKSAVMLKQNGTDLQVSIADPTQLNTGNLNIEVNRNVTAVLSTDPGVTVVQTSPTLKLQVAVNGAAGKSFASHFTINGTSSLTPAGDAYVRDGTYASSSFGTASTITVKSDALSYSRKGLLKFDLSSVEGTITGATLKLMPVSVGMAGITHNLYQTVDANWSEATVTWNNRPANSALVTSWTPVLNTQMQVDLTAQAQAAMGSNKLMSFEIEAAQNYGSAGSVDYASRENATTASRPVLVVTVQ
ncbi:DNRLRE domain-containing protein [Pseudoduganella eburnea]|uniref:DNRLRE domain-containing protein n=1 Tax=Massilia eburnea TaxID=1776165 RepID=A0A6L6QLN0_9BURK|nr:polysaccharide lyase family 8 super-sandwich domain-containing protein [Massilia eburnea]MTW13328.1 DNRLRE domain-containing protein [Massilia eburnea]